MRLSNKTLKKLGFVKKPFEKFPDTWWFDGEPIFVQSSIKKPSDIIRACLITYTPEAAPLGRMSEKERKQTVVRIMKKL